MARGAHVLRSPGLGCHDWHVETNKVNRVPGPGRCGISIEQPRDMLCEKYVAFNLWLNH